MSLFEGVTITLYQNGETVATITTDSNGYAATTINAGYYTLTFSYPDRAPSSFDITINHNNTYLVFAFPYYETLMSQIVTSATLTQTSDVDAQSAEHQFVTVPVFTNDPA
jgi:hypothetical protein